MAKYFDISEFTCNHCGKLPENGMNPVLIEHLDKLREMYGHEIMVSSAYRCDFWNRVNGGVSDSQHLLGNAADVWVNGDYEEFYQLCLDSELFDGIGHYPYEEFVHLDCRNDGNSPNYYRWEG